MVDGVDCEAEGAGSVLVGLDAGASVVSLSVGVWVT